MKNSNFNSNFRYIILIKDQIVVQIKKIENKLDFDGILKKRLNLNTQKKVYKSKVINNRFKAIVAKK